MFRGWCGILRKLALFAQEKLMSTQASPIPPADPDMAEKLTNNRAGIFTPSQRRKVFLIGAAALLFMLCPVVLLIQMFAIIFFSDVPISTLSGVIFGLVGVLILIIFAGLIGVNIQTFLVEAFQRQPVRWARGPLEIRMTEGKRPELPFSYIIADYSFAPYVAPPDVTLRVGAPYVVYYSARSRLLLSIAALDAPDADQWEPRFE
jgi:hypothetical protein